MSTLTSTELHRARMDVRDVMPDRTTVLRKPNLGANGIRTGTPAVPLPIVNYTNLPCTVNTMPDEKASAYMTQYASSTTVGRVQLRQIEVAFHINDDPPDIRGSDNLVVGTVTYSVYETEPDISESLVLTCNCLKNN